MRVLIISALLVATTTIAYACPLAEEQTVGKSSPVVSSPGKSTAGITATYRLKGKPAVGQALRLDIELDAAGEAALLVDVNAPAELGFAAGRLQRELASGDTLSLDLVPQSQGRFYVNVIAHNAANGQARALSIPVQVGHATMKASRAETTPSGELIVRLPAAE